MERDLWWVGFWEQLVKTVNDFIKMTADKASLTSDELRTVLVEVEPTLNF